MCCPFFILALRSGDCWCWSPSVLRDEGPERTSPRTVGGRDTHIGPGWLRSNSNTSEGGCSEKIVIFFLLLLGTRMWCSLDIFNSHIRLVTWKFFQKHLTSFEGHCIFDFLKAGIAQLVEHHLAKVGVAGPNPVSRSRRHSQVVRQGSAKPLFPGSSPGAASCFFLSAMRRMHRFMPGWRNW